VAPFEALYGRRCRTPVCWYESREGVVVGPEIVQQTTEKIKMIQEKMKASRVVRRFIMIRGGKTLSLRRGIMFF
jgi:hypothetical protein